MVLVRPFPLQFPEFDDLYCNYSYVYGQDWDIVSVGFRFSVTASLQVALWLESALPATADNRTCVFPLFI